MLEIDVKEHVPYHVQTENWLIDKNTDIKKIVSLSKEQVFRLHSVEKPDMIYGTTGNELQKDDIKKLDHSLEMIK